MYAYGYCNQKPIKFIDPDGKDPIITGILEAAFAFGLSISLDFFTALILQEKSFEASFKEIGWLSASYDAVVAYGTSTAVPGVASARAIAKFGKSKIGKFVLGTLKEMTKSTADAIAKGKFNDENGEFSFDKFKEEMTNIVIESTIQTLIDNAFDKMALKMIKKFTNKNEKLKEMMQKLENKIANGDSNKRINDYKKRVEEQRKKVEDTRQKVRDIEKEKAVITGTLGKVTGEGAKAIINPE
jgi:hypothetical protein